MKIKSPTMKRSKLYSILFLVASLALTSCGIYKFNDASIDPAVKTIKLGFIENRARYVNPQLSPKLNDKWQLKIASQTKLTRTTSDDAHYIIVVPSPIMTHHKQWVLVTNKHPPTV